MKSTMIFLLLPPDTLRKAGELEQRIEVFRNETKTKKSIILTLVTSEGLKRNAHSDIIQSLIVEDELFSI